MDRETIQKQAVNALLDYGGGLVNVDTGVGKSKILIDFLKQICKPYDTVLLTVPLSKLISNWKEEFVKWSDCSIANDIITMVVHNGYITIELSTIQTAYKWSNRKYTILAIDEAHSQATEAYSNIFENIQFDYCVGLTATMDVKTRPDKQAIYDKYLPLVYQFLEGEKYALINKIKLVIVEHELNNLFKVKTGNKDKQWNVGELQQHEYLTKQLKQGQILMAQAGSANYFSDASEWFWNKKGNKTQADAGRKYLGSITNRRKFLLTLNSSAEIAKRLAKQIIRENDNNKVLVFSELVDQLKKICLYNVYGEQKEELNAELIQSFNESSIRALGSVNSLGMGMNLIGVNNAIFESFNSSTTKAQQKIGRMHRLKIEDTATIYFIKIKNTQSEQWLESMLSEYNLSDVKTINSNLILT